MTQTTNLPARPPRDLAMARVAAAAAVAALASVPLWGDASAERILGEFLVYAALATLWNLLASYGGLLSVGQQAFIGIGGFALYGFTVLAGVPMLAALPLVALVGLVAAVPMGLLSLRLSGPYFAIGTWAIAEILRLTVLQFPSLGGGSGASLPSDVLHTLGETRAVRSRVVYAVAFAVAAGSVGITFALLRSRWGLGLRALRDSGIAAEAVGVRVKPLKIALFCVVGVMTSLVGAVVVMQKLRVAPDPQFAVVDWTAFVIFMVVIGGYGTIEGPLLGAALFILLRELLADFGTVYQIVLGAIAIVMMVAARKGVWGLARGASRFPLLSVVRRSA
ncbi:MAG TPA: branched-chain amino acid ABC transporter permease [Novosphingobium sp.]|nr:branched-chain amino acid ABC transporter permease [Novosphingobium sp.]